MSKLRFIPFILVLFICFRGCIRTQSKKEEKAAAKDSLANRPKYDSCRINQLQTPKTIEYEDLGLRMDAKGRVCLSEKCIKELRTSKPKTDSSAFSDWFMHDLFHLVKDDQHLHPSHKKFKNSIRIEKKDTNWQTATIAYKFFNIDSDPEKELVIMVRGYNRWDVFLIVAKKVDGVYRIVFVDQSIRSRFEPEFLILNSAGPNCSFGIKSEVGGGPESWTDYNFFKTCKNGEIKNVLHLQEAPFGPYGLVFDKSLKIKPEKDIALWKRLNIAYHFGLKSYKMNSKPKSGKHQDVFNALTDYDATKAYNLINNTFNIRYVFNDTAQEFQPDYVHSDINAEQYSVLDDNDEENYYDKKYIRKTLTIFDSIIRKNTEHHPQNQSALNWLYKEVGMKH